MVIENKHDPRLKKNEDLEITQIVGNKIVDEILADLQGPNPSSLTDQSWIITGARGAGKSHLLTLLYRKINADKKLASQWLPLIFPEELFSVDSLYRFYMVVIENALKECADIDSFDAIRKRYQKIISFRFSGKAKDRAEQRRQQTKKLGNLIKEATVASSKKWILILENLQDIFGRQLSEDEQKSLRAFMHENPETFIIAGSALSIFGITDDYSMPFFQFFRMRGLEGLNQEEVAEFLLKIGTSRNEESHIEELVKKNQPYISTFQLLTGGNPRLVLFLYELMLDHEELNTSLILGKILELTPYFRDRTNEASSLRRHIIEALALGAPAQSVSEIADYINGDIPATSGTCKQMAKEGWLRPISISAPDIKKKETFYALRDYFYRVWYKLRTGHIDESEEYCLAELAVLLLKRPELKRRLQEKKECNSSDLCMYEKAVELIQDDRFMKNINMLQQAAESEYLLAEKERLLVLAKNIQKLKKLLAQKKYREVASWIPKLKQDPILEELSYLAEGFMFQRSGKNNKAIFALEEIQSSPYFDVSGYLALIYFDENKYVESWNALRTSLLSKFGSFHQYNGKVAFFKELAQSVFSHRDALTRLLAKESTRETQFDCLVEIVLLGKLNSVCEIVDELLNNDEDFPEEARMLLLFFMEDFLIDAMRKGVQNVEVSALIRYLFLFKMKQVNDEGMKKWFISFVYRYLSLAQKDEFRLGALEELTENIRDAGILVSDMFTDIVKALQKPNSRHAKVWKTDPLFAKIVTEIQS